jgi:hypothetical protein
MTETEWNTCTDPQPMLELLRGQTRNRKLRLFAAGCCRSVWEVLAAGGREQIETAEKYADDLVTVDALYDGDWHTGDEDGQRLASLEESYVWDALAAVGLDDTVVDYFSSISNIARAGALPEDRQRQCHLLRCIFGNPFNPVTAYQARLTPVTRSLAKAIYDDRAFDRMPILADALEEAGCDNGEILEHCRGPGPHVRGCWVVDLVLGKG